MTVVDAGLSTVSRIQFTHSPNHVATPMDWTGSVVSTTKLYHCGYLEPYFSWIYEGSIILPCVPASGRGHVLVYSYPQGGNPTGKIGRNSLTFPYGTDFQTTRYFSR